MLSIFPSARVDKRERRRAEKIAARVATKINLWPHERLSLNFLTYR